MKGKIVMRWDKYEVQRLRGMWQRGLYVEAMATALGRTPKAVEQRLYKIGLKPAWEGPRQ